MMKALRLCESSTLVKMWQTRSQSSRQLDYRMFSIHHRLASLYHNSYRNQVRKNCMIFHSKSSSVSDWLKSHAKIIVTNYCRPNLEEFCDM